MPSSPPLSPFEHLPPGRFSPVPFCRLAPRWDDLAAGGERLIESAIRHGREEVALFFLIQGADPFAQTLSRDDQGRPTRGRPFECALERSMARFVRRALDGLSPSRVREHEAQWANDIEPSLSPGARLFPRGSSWAHLAIKGPPEIARSLRLAGARADRQDAAGRSAALRCVTAGGPRELFAELVLAGSSVWATDEFGVHAAQLAPEDWLFAGLRMEAREIAIASDREGLCRSQQTLRL